MINDDGPNFNLTIWQLGTTTAATLEYDWKTTTKGQLQLEISYIGQNNDLKDQTSITVVLLVARPTTVLDNHFIHLHHSS